MANRNIKKFTVTLPNNQKIYFDYTGESCRFVDIPDGMCFEFNGEVWEKFSRGDAGNLSNFDDEGMIISNPIVKRLKQIK